MRKVTREDIEKMGKSEFEKAAETSDKDMLKSGGITSGDLFHSSMCSDELNRIFSENSENMHKLLGNYFTLATMLACIMGDDMEEMHKMQYYNEMLARYMVSVYGKDFAMGVVEVRDILMERHPSFIKMQVDSEEESGQD